MKGILFRPEVWEAKKLVLKQHGIAQTRRVIKLDQFGWLKCDDHLYCFIHKDTKEHLVIQPRYLPDETVYVKEPHLDFGYWSYDTAGKWTFHQQDEVGVFFPDNCPAYLIIIREREALTPGWYVRSPLFLKEKHARSFLTIVSARPERLQDITNADAIAEGTPINDFVPVGCATLVELDVRYFYAELWDTINPDLPWASNTWVWRYEIKEAEGRR